MRVDLENIWLMQSLRVAINTTNLDDIEFYENDEKVDIPIVAKKEFELTGLSNIDFITTGKYKTRSGFNNSFPPTLCENCKIDPSGINCENSILNCREVDALSKGISV